jgi:hypothetical protein
MVQVQTRKLYEQKKQTYLDVLVDRIQIVCILLNVDILEGRVTVKGAVSDDVFRRERGLAGSPSLSTVVDRSNRRDERDIKLITTNITLYRSRKI